MLGGKELILELGHLGLGRVDGLAEFVADKGLGTAMNLGKRCGGGLKLCGQRLNSHPHLLKDGAGQSLALRKQGEQEMLVADLLLTETGSDVDGPVEGLLHLGCEFVRLHKSVSLPV